MQRRGKRTHNNRGIVENGVFYSVLASGYKEENWGNQFSLALQGRLRSSAEVPAVKKRLYMCCSYSQCYKICCQNTTSEE
jgi:hypothetical protein